MIGEVSIRYGRGEDVRVLERADDIRGDEVIGEESFREMR